jgi:hypothetical protein
MEVLHFPWDKSNQTKSNVALFCTVHSCSHLKE